MGGAENEKALGERLQLARRRAGLTQQELCQKAGLSYSTLAKIERGAIRTPSVFTVAAVAEITQTPLEELLGMRSGHLRPSVASEPKKTSKSGVKFVYFDVNGVLVRFFQRAFTEVARVAGKPADIVETLFWRHNDTVNKGHMSLREFNARLAKELGLEGFDWQKYYLHNAEPMPEIDKLVRWTSTHYEVGLISNSMPGAINALKDSGKIPDVSYTAIVDSTKVGAIKPEPRIYEVAEQLAAVKSREILLVDDSRANLTAADHKGWHVLWFNDFHPSESIDHIRQSLAF